MDNNHYNKYIKYKTKYLKLDDNSNHINNNQIGGDNNLIIHISGAQGSGKTTLGYKLKKVFNDKIHMMDLDDLFGKFSQQSKIQDYQQYIYKFIKVNPQ